MCYRAGSTKGNVQVPVRRLGFTIYKLTGGRLPRGLFRDIRREPSDAAIVRDVRSKTLVGGEKVYNVHDPRLCVGQPCCIHNPSPHHMRTWRQHWRADRGLMERICPQHGTGHPDPDHMAFLRSQALAGRGRLTLEDVSAEGVHGCCGCCDPEKAMRTA